MSKNKKIIIGIVLAVIILAALWWAYSMMQSSGGPVRVNTKTINMVENSQIGNFLVGPNDMTLYAKKGEFNSSTCYDQCAINWPPLRPMNGLVLGTGVTGALGQIERTDGTSQLTYNGKPLYYWTGDTAVGNTSGNGFGGVWSVVAP